MEDKETLETMKARMDQVAISFWHFSTKPICSTASIPVEQMDTCSTGAGGGHIS